MLFLIRNCRLTVRTGRDNVESSTALFFPQCGQYPCMTPSAPLMLFERTVLMWFKSYINPSQIFSIAQKPEKFTSELLLFFRVVDFNFCYLVLIFFYTEWYKNSWRQWEEVHHLICWHKSEHTNTYNKYFFVFQKL